MTGTEATDTSDVTEQRPQWSLATLIAFRFGTCYFGSFGLALVIGLIPVISRVLIARWSAQVSGQVPGQGPVLDRGSAFFQQGNRD